MWRVWLVLSIALVALGIVSATIAAPAPAPRPGTVEIREFMYAPGAMTVSRGTTVRWVNRDEETHTVTSATGAFASAGLAHDDAFERRFTEPGTYRYFCALHPKMTATVVVR